MSQQVHSTWLVEQFDGTANIDLDDTVDGDDVRFGIYTESAINQHTVDNVSALTAVATGTAWTGPVSLANMTFAKNGSNQPTFDADDPAQIAQDAGGFSDGRSVVVFLQSTGRILWNYIHGSVFGNVGGPINITVNANGFFNITFP